MTENEAIEDFEMFCKGKILCVTGEALEMVRTAVKDAQHYRTIENKLKEIHGDWIDLLSFGEAYAEWVIKKNGGVPQKIVHLTDDHVDMWNEYKAIGAVEECEKAMDFELAKQDKSLAEVIDEYLEYIKIGTIEEFNALKEKSVAKKPIRKPNHNWTDEEVICPACGSYILGNNHHCKCGQALET